MSPCSLLLSVVFHFCNSFIVTVYLAGKPSLSLLLSLFMSLSCHLSPRLSILSSRSALSLFISAVNSLLCIVFLFILFCFSLCLLYLQLTNDSLTSFSSYISVSHRFILSVARCSFGGDLIITNTFSFLSSPYF